VLIEADENGYRVHPCRVEYDRTAAIEAVRRSNHPLATSLSIGFPAAVHVVGNQRRSPLGGPLGWFHCRLGRV